MSRTRRAERREEPQWLEHAAADPEAVALPCLAETHAELKLRTCRAEKSGAGPKEAINVAEKQWWGVIGHAYGNGMRREQSLRLLVKSGPAGKGPRQCEHATAKPEVVLFPSHQGEFEASEGGSTDFIACTWQEIECDSSNEFFNGTGSGKELEEREGRS
ncbi:hypothetical protein B0H11DRAFT_1908392 [Mycena galericulata]|nr:hypothetical protein B0H11DRAFT_1908392 [Mycena galericulata]